MTTKDMRKRALGFYGAGILASVLFPGVGAFATTALVNRGKDWSNLANANEEIEASGVKLSEREVTRILKKNGVNVDKYLEF